MFNLVMFSVFLILKAEANELESENPAIHIDYKYNSKEIYKAWKGKPLQIIIHNSYASEVWCSDSYLYFNSAQCKGEYKKFVPETKLKIENVTILNITEVTAEMSTRWSCVVLQEYHGPINYKHENEEHTGKNLYFDLHVKGARSVNLTLNDRNLTYVTTNLSVSYDGAANYTYEDGEYVDFSCRRRDSDCHSTEIRLEYYNAEDIRLFETKPRVKGEQIFRSVLKSKSDKSYLDCILTTSSREYTAREYRYRTTFYMKKRADATQQAIMLYVNGQDLPIFKYKNIENTSDGYIFKYIDGEVFNVTCRKMDDSKRGTLSFYFDSSGNTVVGNPEKEIILSNVSTSKIHNKTLACVIKNTSVLKPNAILLFSSDIPDYGVRVRGLPRNNVLYQYSNGIDQWTIEYQYSVNDTLNLNCVSKYGIQTSSESRRLFQQSEEDEFEWKFEGQTIKSPAIITSIESNIYLSNRTFTKILDATHDGKKIQCVHYFSNIYSNKLVEIILRLKPELVSEVDSDGLASGSDTGKTLPDTQPSANPVKYNGYPSLIVGSSVGAVLVILGVVGIACWHRRSRNVQHIETPSADITNENDCPTPQITNECEYEYDYCHNEGIYYTEVDYSRCKQKAGEARTRNSKVYDEPYVHM